MIREQFYEDVAKEIKENINRLHERSQKTKSDLDTHEAVCAERYKNLLIALERMDKAIEHNNQQVTNLYNLASEGKVSLKTLIRLGTFFAFVIGAVYTILGIYNSVP